MPVVTMTLTHDLAINRAWLGTEVRNIIGNVLDVDPSDDIYLTVIVLNPNLGDHQPCGIFLNIEANKTKERERKQKELIKLIWSRVSSPYLELGITVDVRLELSTCEWYTPGG